MFIDFGSVPLPSSASHIVPNPSDRSYAPPVRGRSRGDPTELFFVRIVDWWANWIRQNSWEDLKTEVWRLRLPVANPNSLP